MGEEVGLSCCYSATPAAADCQPLTIAVSHLATSMMLLVPRSVAVYVAMLKKMLAKP